MKFVKDGEWMVGTPMMAGFEEAVRTALRCVHPSWSEESRAIDTGKVLVSERCSECVVATRMKYRPATEAEKGVGRGKA